MSNILAQMNPTAMISVVALILLSVAAVLILRIIRAGRATSPADLVKIAREKSAASKETKAATKRAEATIAEPMTSSRLSRISTKGMADASAARPDVEADADADADADLSIDAGQDAIDAPVTSASDVGPDALYQPEAELAWEVDEAEDADQEDAHAAAAHADDDQDSNEADTKDLDAKDNGSAAAAQTAPGVVPDRAIDLADPANHPANWDGLIAIIDRLDVILAQPWHDDGLIASVQSRLAAARAVAGESADEDPAVRAVARDAAAIDLARTINNAAREQAAEVVAAVREFAHQHAFSPQDCAAVLQALQQIEWMALIAQGDKLEKRTLPLTRHDPDAPLWVAAAFDDLRAADDRAAA